jgi:hypothetical protein
MWTQTLLTIVLLTTTLPLYAQDATPQARETMARLCQRQARQTGETSTSFLAELRKRLAEQNTPQTARPIRDPEKTSEQSPLHHANTTITLAGWSITCSVDPMHDTRECQASKGGVFGVRFSASERTASVIYIAIAGSHYPGMLAYMRVDGHQAHSRESSVFIVEQTTPLFQQLRQGKTLLTRCPLWPSGIEEQQYDITGMGEAMDYVMQQIKTPQAVQREKLLKTRMKPPKGR